MPYTVVFIRHGESAWNLENRFTGWTDVDLTEKGLLDAAAAGTLMKENGLTFDIAHTSLLMRSIKTLNAALDSMGLLWIPVYKSWRLNERFYGALQGLNKAETAEQYGEEQVKIWRRSYSTQPPQVEVSDERHPSHDRRYAQIDPAELPCGESLADTVARALPYWNETIVPDIRAGKRVIVAAHGNSLRALVQYLDQMSEDEVTELNIPVGTPLVYELDDDLHPISHRYLGDQEAIEAAIHAVANQGKKN